MFREDSPYTTTKKLDANVAATLALLMHALLIRDDHSREQAVSR
jgi:hypothetical protein